jgi:hypothetical protein
LALRPIDSRGDDRPGSPTALAETLGCLQAPTANRSGVSSRVPLGAVSKQQREFGRLPQSPNSSHAIRGDRRCPLAVYRGHRLKPAAEHGEVYGPGVGGLRRNG